MRTKIVLSYLLVAICTQGCIQNKNSSAELKEISPLALQAVNNEIYQKIINADVGEALTVKIIEVNTPLPEAQMLPTLADIVINEQAKALGDKYVDNAPQNLFTYVNEAKLAQSLYASYIKLLDNYSKDVLIEDVLQPAQLAEVDEFLDAIIKSHSMQVSYEYITTILKFDINANRWKQELFDIWFKAYATSPSKPISTSAFEHLFVGEIKDARCENATRYADIGGMHYWLATYLEEKAGNLNYYGTAYLNKEAISPHPTESINIQFEWNPYNALTSECRLHARKKVNGVFLGMSPAAVFAMATTAYFEKLRNIYNPNGERQAQINGHTYTLFEQDIPRHDSIVEPINNRSDTSGFLPVVIDNNRSINFRSFYFGY